MDNNEENKNVEPVMEESKTVESPKKKGSSPLVIVLLVLVLALVGFDVWYFALGGNKVLSGKTEEPEEKEKKDDNDNSGKESESGAVTLSEDEKTALKDIVSYLIERNITGSKKISVSDLSNQEILSTVRVLKLTANELTEEEMNAYVKEVFGDVTFTHESIKCPICGFEYYKYSSTDHKYVKTADDKHSGHGGGSYVLHGIHFESAEKDASTNKLTATFKVIYSQLGGDVIKAPDNFYPTFTDMKNETNGLFSSPIEWSESVTDASLYEKAYTEAGDKIPNTVATFGIENGHYYLETIELP